VYRYWLLKVEKFQTIIAVDITERNSATERILNPLLITTRVQKKTGLSHPTNAFRSLQLNSDAKHHI